MTRRAGTIVAAIAAVLITAAAAAWAVTAGSGDSAGPERGVTLADVVGQPARFEGDVVTVSGQVSARNWLPSAFALGDRLDERAVVIPARGTSLPFGLSAEDVVRVRGRVGIFRSAGLRTETAHWGDDEFLDDFEGAAMIRAVDVEILRAGGTSPIPGDQPEATTGETGRPDRSPRE